MDGDMIARLAYLGLLLAAVGGYIIVEFRGRMGQALRTAAAWGLIVVGLMAGYGLWHDLRPGLLPRQAVVEGGEIRLPRAADGHYYLTLTIGGTPMPFMVDTGASQVVLSLADARRLGIDPSTLAFIGEARTANGIVRTARVTLTDVALGPHRDDRLGAVVNEGDLDTSLLGMSYLGRYSIEITSGEMILRR
ncbi:MAG: TIGR02281 family clan AA aspartic protease [Pseudotabrizicola sp.]|uniref:retropepsin-like aspartic protease family protein n=1 Tax=Pseudotabrizicola sp. TaxID=2939647 RepID=UPI0027307E8C|nr:TIGR02281 family clan AA aspartic protease [Pseudotabrizicola sp.]MDP2082782.1 TIGR02281 family clan AA aspartic protease [Pseudotabrizicola sp.]MDZ7576245.1 TIGR02281 family clan AA aspartic protease [Pseudotabrizicola sp.]